MLRAINAITITGGIVLLVMSLWPGFTGGCAFLFLLPLIGMLGLTWAVVVGREWFLTSTRSRAFPTREAMLAPVTVCLTFALLLFYVPRRIAFVFVRSQFYACVASAVPTPSGPMKLDRRIGIYHIDEYAVDPRGGVYFRTGMGPDGMSMDTLSCGFVYQPNAEGSPFGAAKYVVRPLGNGWYWFQVSDDWF